MNDESKPRRAAARPRAGRSRGQPRIFDRALRVGNAEIPLHSGAMHYWRLDREAWRPGLTEIRNLGLSIVETYIPWGVHETAPGEIDFGERDPRKDVGAFLDLARELDLLVFARPGPHINAELTNFGLPERIVHDKACQARSPRQNPVLLSFPPQMFPVPSYASSAYHAEVGKWYDAVATVLAPRMWPEGPVAIVQVDNEAAFYFRNGPYCQDYHPDAIALWRKWLEKRYGDLDGVAAAHRMRYASWDDVQAPLAFEGNAPDDLVLHCDWAHFQEEILTDALDRMKKRLIKAGIKNVPMVHNVPLGDGGLPVNVPAMGKVVDLVGLDYYHARREHRVIKRRSLYLAGTVDFPYAPELGVGAPPWFTPLAHDDSLFCAMTACAYGVRGFNLYMAVDRDRWYGAPIDGSGMPRVEAGAWKHLVQKLHELRFHVLERHVEVALVVPREYARLSRATHLLGPFSPSMLEVTGASPVDACRSDSFGFLGPVQVLWWKMLARFADALTAEGIPYVYVDGEADPERLEGMRVVITPSYEFVAAERWKRMAQVAQRGAVVVYGPAQPSLDERMRHQLFEVPRDGRRVMIDSAEDAVEVVRGLADELVLERPFRATPAPVETAVHHDAERPRVLFVINPGDTAVEAAIELPAPATLLDSMNGDRFSGDSLVHLPIGARACRMFEVDRIADGMEQARRRRSVSP